MRLDHLQRADIALSKCGRPLPPGDGVVAIDIPYGIRYQAVVAAAQTQQQPFQPNFLRSPYPIVPASASGGNGLLLVQLWNTTDEQLRVQLQIVALEPKQ